MICFGQWNAAKVMWPFDIRPQEASFLLFLGHLPPEPCEQAWESLLEDMRPCRLEMIHHCPTEIGPINQQNLPSWAQSKSLKFESSNLPQTMTVPVCSCWVCKQVRPWLLSTLRDEVMLSFRTKSRLAIKTILNISFLWLSCKTTGCAASNLDLSHLSPWYLGTTRNQDYHSDWCSFMLLSKPYIIQSWSLTEVICLLPSFEKQYQ